METPRPACVVGVVARVVVGAGRVVVGAGRVVAVVVAGGRVVAVALDWAVTVVTLMDGGSEEPLPHTPRVAAARTRTASEALAREFSRVRLVRRCTTRILPSWRSRQTGSCPYRSYRSYRGIGEHGNEVP